MTIVEATLNQVRLDKQRLDAENKRLEDIMARNMKDVKPLSQIETFKCYPTERKIHGRDQADLKYTTQIKSEYTDLSVSEGKSPISEASRTSKNKLIQNLCKNVFNQDDSESKGKNPLIAEQVFRRSEAGSQDHTRRSIEMSRS